MRYKIQKAFIWALMSLWGATIYTGCSDVKFHAVPTQACIDHNETYGPGTCVTTNGVDHFSYTKTFGDIDILFVIDNSGSMYVEQSLMAARIQGFIGFLEEEGFNYNIAMTTTDISETGDSTNELQDGNFIEFTNAEGVKTGTSVLTPETGDNVGYRSQIFENTIKRQETLDCEQSNFAEDSCPSFDERGIYAANLVLDRADSSFFRQGAHLAIVFLSDEDERGKGVESTFQSYDSPETLVGKINTQLGAAKGVSFYSLIIKPGDKECKKEQDEQPNEYVYGEYGVQYARLSDAKDSELLALGNVIGGYTGNICADDYKTQLDIMAELIGSYTYIEPLVCDPQEINVSVGGEALTSDSYHVEDGNLVIDRNITPGDVVDLKVDCLI
ncbi:MAG: hypothetical protein HOO06_02480 [Bdellovibrionaceae bacterium]|nr:hypothetical protein [Pseudobdellovibrionaceae bacterium]